MQEKDALKCQAKWIEMTPLFSFIFNPLSANPTKWSNTLKQFVVFDQFVGLVLKGLMILANQIVWAFRSTISSEGILFLIIAWSPLYQL